MTLLGKLCKAVLMTTALIENVFAEDPKAVKKMLGQDIKEQDQQSMYCIDYLLCIIQVLTMYICCVCLCTHYFS